MRVIKVYRPPGKESPFETFLTQQNPKLRHKLQWTLFRLAQAEVCELKEPHFKHFALERYSPFYEMREKHRMMTWTRWIFATARKTCSNCISSAPTASRWRPSAKTTCAIWKQRR